VPEAAVLTRPAGPDGVRPSARRLVAAQTRYALTDFWRTPVAAFFTLAFPLLWLVALLLVTGNPVIDPGTGRRLAQLMTPSAIVFATGMSCFSTMPIAVVAAREQGVLKRLRGTPLPGWAYLAGRVLAAAVVSFLAVGLLLAVAVGAYGVELTPGAVASSLLVVVLGIVCFSALGLAVASLVRSATVAQAVTPALLVVLAFVSGMFVDAGSLPGWARRLGSLLPLEPYAAALGARLDPGQAGGPSITGDLLVMAAWTAVGALVAVRWFSWQPRSVRPTTPARASADGLPRQAPRPRAPRGAGEARRPSHLRLLVVQTRYAVRDLWRDRTSMFFAIGLPLVLMLLVAGLSGEDAEVDGMPMAQYLAPAMAAYGIFVAAYATLPETVAVARDSGILKRLRGTPLPSGLYLAGRVCAAFVLGTVVLGVLVAVAVVFLGAGVDPTTLPALALTLLLGTACAAALGLALAALVRPAKAVPAVALGTLLPLAFVSDVFVLGASPPAWVQAVASALPLKPFAKALAHALDPAGAGTGLMPQALAVLAAWTVAGAVLAWWGFAGRDASRSARAQAGAPRRPASSMDSATRS
jgi:ABC-2 type transport system permease protein